MKSEGGDGDDERQGAISEGGRWKEKGRRGEKHTTLRVNEKEKGREKKGI